MVFMACLYLVVMVRVLWWVDTPASVVILVGAQRALQASGKR